MEPLAYLSIALQTVLKVSKVLDHKQQEFVLVRLRSWMLMVCAIKLVDEQHAKWK